MIIWLLGLVYVIWYGSFRKPISLNPWLWAVLGTLAYVFFALALNWGLYFAMVLPISTRRELALQS